MFSFLKLFIKLFLINGVFINQFEQKSRIFAVFKIGILKYDYEILVVYISNV